MRGIFVLIGILLVMGSPSHTQAEECTPSGFAGQWQNIRQEKTILSSLEVIDTCEPNGPYGAVQVRGMALCHPRDCSWGWSGALVEDGALYAEFKTFVATRRIRAVKQGLRLEVLVATDYITEEREDTRVSHILVRSAK